MNMAADFVKKLIIFNMKVLKNEIG